MDQDESSKPKRKHRATGKAKGGARQGAGRPEGSFNALNLGEVGAVKAAGLRVPATASPQERDLADECLDTITRVMRGQVSYLEAPVRLKASAVLREEICGPVAQKHELTGKDGERLRVSININRGQK